MKKSRINPMSDKKRKGVNESLPILKECCERAKGTFVTDNIIKHGCLGGECEDCGERQPYGQPRLHPHHIIFQSHGGKTDVENIAMVCPNCHSKAHNINVVHSQPMWKRKEG